VSTFEFHFQQQDTEANKYLRHRCPDQGSLRSTTSIGLVGRALTPTTIQHDIII